MEQQADPGLNVRVEKIRLGDLKFLEHNARFFTHDRFARLVENIKGDGTLTSVPFAWKDDDESYLVLSGNHRTKAAIEAFGPDHEAFVMLCDDPMPKDRRTALQLAHNAIAGEDDPATLKELYESLEDVDWRMYSGLDDKHLDLLENVELGSLSEASLEFQVVTITFLPVEKEAAERALQAARDDLQGSNEVWLAKRDDHVRTLDSLDAAGKSYGVRNIATSLGLVLDVFENHPEDLRNGYLNEEGLPVDEKRWVPLYSIFGANLPAGAAAVIQRAVGKILERDEASHPWQALEMLAADYLAGPDG